MTCAFAIPSGHGRAGARVAPRRIAGIAAVWSVALLVWSPLAGRAPREVMPQRSLPLSALPVAARGVVARTLGSADRQFFTRPTTGGVAMTSRRAGIDASFTRSGGVVRAGGAAWAIGLRAFGRGGRLRAMVPVSPRSSGNRVRYDRPGVREWYVGTGLGLEQGFTLARRPPGAQRTAVALALGALPPGLRASLAGDRRSATVTRSGVAVLRYSGLVVSDARGRQLPAWIEVSGRHLELRLDDRRARYPLRVDPFVQVARLTASDGAIDDHLGRSVAISQNTIVAGAPDAASAAGAVYVFVKPASGWADATQVAKLTASDGRPGDNLGTAVAISGDTIVAGAPEAHLGSPSRPGAAYVFVRPAGGWSDGPETAKLIADDGADTNDAFGSAVAISGGTAVIGAPNAAVGGHTLQGAAYVFVKPAGGWASVHQAARLTTSDGAASARLGMAVAADGDTVVAGAGGALQSHGAAYVFVKPGAGWSDRTQAAELTASDEATIRVLGASVAISGDTVVAGAPGAGPAGAVYVFVKPGGGWADGHQAAKLTGSDAAAQDEVGGSVAVSGETVVAGAGGHNVSVGAAYVFVEPAGGWADGTSAATLTPTQETTTAAAFGSSVAVDGGTIVAGAPAEEVGATGQQGAAYVFAGTRSTSTQVGCAPAAVAAGQTTTCTATVSRTAATPDQPTGSMTFASDSDGSFGFGATCELSATHTAGVASCSVIYTPAAVGSGTHAITARYGGDAADDPSTGATTVTVTAPGGGNTGGGGGSGSGGNGGGGTGPAGTVTPRFRPLGQSQKLHHALLLDAGPSTSTAGPIVNYTWTTSTGGSGGTAHALVTPCGTSRLAALTFKRSGPQMVSLSVRSALGQTATITQPVNVPVDAVNPAPQPAFDCENPAAGNQSDHGACVKTFGWGVVQVNSRGSRDCFELTQRQVRLSGHAGAARAAQSPVSTQTMWLTRATVRGPVAIDGLYLPLLESVQSSFDNGDSTIQIGSPIEVLVGSYHLASIVLNAKIGDPDRHTHLVPLVPNVGLTGGNNQIGKLPLAGTVDVNLSSLHTKDGYNIAKVKVHVKLPPPFPSVPVDGYLETDNETGVHITGFQVGPFDTSVLPGFTLKKAFFKYVGGSDDVWSGGADVYLPGQVSGPGGAALPASVSPVPGLNFAPPPPDLGIGFKRGHLDHFGIGVNFVPPFQPVLFPGVNLSNVHFAFGLTPLRFTGGIGLDVGTLIGVNGDVFVAFATPDHPYAFPSDVPAGTLQPLVGRWLDSFTIGIGGNIVLELPVAGEIPLLNAWMIYEAPDYFEIGSHFDFKAGFIELKGDAGGWVLPSQGKFSFGGDLNLCLNVSVLGFDLSPCLGNGIVVSSRGIGGCASVLVPLPPPIPGAVPVTISAGYTWDGELEVIPFTCDLSDFTESNPRAAAVGTPQSFALPSGLPSAVVRVEGTGGAPGVTLTGPGGKRYSTASPPQDPRQGVILLQYGDTTVIAVKHPAGGRWTVTQDPGSVAIADVAYARGLPAPHVKARIAGRGSTRTLTYRDTPAPGRVITFIEHGARTYRILGVAHGARGRIRFRPADGRAGRRRIVAQVEENGLQTQSPVVAHYAAPGPRRPRRPARVRAKHAGYAVKVSWRAVAGASTYEVLVRSSDGGREMQIVSGHRARVATVEPGLHGTVLVRAVSAAGRRSAPSRRAFRAVRRARRHH